MINVTPNMVAVADQMHSDVLDYADIDGVTLYSYFNPSNGPFEVWIVDPKDSCHMDDAVKLVLVKSFGGLL